VPSPRPDPRRPHACSTLRLTKTRADDLISLTPLLPPPSPAPSPRRRRPPPQPSAGDGIGPEISDSVVRVFAAAGAPIDWDRQSLAAEVDPRTNSFVSQDNLDSLLRHGAGLKGPMATPIGKGHRSLNITLRQALGLYANVRPCKSLPGYKTRYDDVDLVTIRENTEGEYSGVEGEWAPSELAFSMKIITRRATERVCRYAFQYAVDHGRRSVTCVHKANIMKQSDGLFLRTCREVSEDFPSVPYREMIVDNACMQLVSDPSQFDVLVMPNLYGDILSDLCAGLIGGLGLTPSGNVGADGLFLAEAVHGTAPDIAGRDLANPTALLLSGCMLLRHLGRAAEADRVERATLGVIAEGRWRTGDLGGTAKTSEFTQAILDAMA